MHRRSAPGPMFYFFLLFLCLISFFFFPRVSVWELNIAVLSELRFSVAVLIETCFFALLGTWLGIVLKLSTLMIIFSFDVIKLFSGEGLE